MGKLSKEEAARFSGAEWMLRYAKEHGIDAAEKELEQRGIRNMPLAVNKQDLQRFSNYEKRNSIATVTMMAVVTLRDEYGFGKKRMHRFLDRFSKKTECLLEGYVNWRDFQETIKAETGIFIPLPDEFLEMGEE